MKKHSCHPECKNGLKRICGTTLNLDDLEFAPTRNHLLYMDKIYSKGQGTACPIMFWLETDPATFQVELLMEPYINESTGSLCEEIFGCDCRNHHHHFKYDSNCGFNNNHSDYRFDCCCNNCCTPTPNCQLDDNAVFNVIRSYVKVTNFSLVDPLCLNTNQVTIDGLPVDSLAYTGNSYVASFNSNLQNIIKSECSEEGLATKAFFLISNAGPWCYQAEFILEGTVNTGGNTCCFRATFTSNEPCNVVSPLAVTNIAVPKISIPCISGGMSPELYFSFSGNINLLSPELCIVQNEETGSLQLVLKSCVAAEPEVEVEVVKKALFCINGCEAIFPCEGEEELQEDDEGPLEEECQCGTVSNVRDNCNCNNNNENNNCSPCQAAAVDNNCGNTVAFGTNSSCSSCYRGY